MMRKELKQFYLIKYIEPESVFYITPKGFNINNRGCNPRKKSLAFLATLKGLNLLYKMLLLGSTHSGLSCLAYSIPWAIPTVIKIKPCLTGRQAFHGFKN
jgi:hypothetical protein